jgi:hypothetical protein
VTRRRACVAAAALALLLGGTRLANAQGNSAGHGHAHQGGVTAGAGGSASPLPASGAGIRAFGVWLDDASVAAPGGGWATLSLGCYRTDLFHELDVPIADAGVGLTRRVQTGFSVPVYNVTPIGGVRAHGLGDLYLHTKIQLRDPVTSSDGTGFAVLPIVEVLAEPLAGQRKVNWALPVSVEARREGWRAYGAGGYFSRGSLFGSVALERAVTSRVSVTGTFSDSFTTKVDPAVPQNLGRSRADVSAGASYAAGPSWIVFGSIGRTITAHEPDSTNLAFVAGVSLNLAAPAQTRKRPRR